MEKAPGYTEEVLDNIRPGMNIFLGSGSAEPRTLMKCLMESDQSNANDLELIQLGTHRFPQDCLRVLTDE